MRTSSNNSRFDGSYCIRKRKVYSSSNVHFVSRLCLVFALTTSYFFYPCHNVNAASTEASEYIINGQLSIYLTKQANTRPPSIGRYVNIMFIEKTATEKETEKVTLAETGFNQINKQPMPFKLSYSEIPKHSKNTANSFSQYNIHIVIAGNKSGTPVITTMTTQIFPNQNYNDLNLVFQALPKPRK